jgi:hypothetical protein
MNTTHLRKGTTVKPSEQRRTAKPLRGSLGSKLILGFVTTLCAVVGVLFAAAPAFAAKEYVPVGSFGMTGSSGGAFVEPTGVAVNDSLSEATGGDVYVLDNGNARVQWFNANGTKLEGQFTGAGTPAKSFSDPDVSAENSLTGIAVDNSGKPLEDPSVGDVYVADNAHRVVDKFSATGKYEGQVTGTCPAAGTCSGAEVIRFSELQGVAVDSTGDLWVSGQSIAEFSSTGSFIKAFQPPLSLHRGMAIDSVGDVYAGCLCGRAMKIDSTTGELIETIGLGEVTALTINPATNNLLLDERGSIKLYGPFGEPHSSPLQTFGQGVLFNSQGIAVDGTSGTAYASNKEANDVEIFEYQSFPTVTLGTAQAAESVAKLQGSVNPEGETISECQFEYGAEAGVYTNSVPCAPAVPFSGNEAVPVAAEVSGLEPHSIYHFRLTATATHTRSSRDETFFTTVKPSIEGESVSAVEPTASMIHAELNPGGLPTTYRVEYGETLPYTSVTSVVNAGAGIETTNVQVHLSGLQPGTSYHARVTAENELGIAQGGDLTFLTPAVSGSSGSTLPDGRVYEDVSLLDGGDGEVYFPITGHERLAGFERLDINQVGTGDPVRASADGDAVAYAAEPPPVGGSGSTGQGGGNVFIAKRGATGWTPKDIMPPDPARELYQGFSSDLSRAFLDAGNEPLAAGVPPNCSVLYWHSADDDAYHAAFTTTETPGACGFPRLAGASGDGSAVLFESEARLTADAPEGNEGRGEEEFNLYDSVDGHLFLVNVLPSGKPDVKAAFGGVSQEGEENLGFESPGYHHYGQIVSENGSRIAWTDLNTGNLYVRKDPSSPSASTVLVADDAYFRGASSDGSKILYTKEGDLYEFDLNTETQRNLAPNGSVLGLLGSSEDASHVYFVAKSATLALNENAQGETAAPGKPNLYLVSGGDTRFIATLSSEDNSFIGVESSNFGAVMGDWSTGLGTRTAKVSPDGLSVVFMSRRSLTGYDNTGGCLNSEVEPAGCPEVFTYSADAQRVYCASCNPTGAPPVAALVDGQQNIGGAFLPTPNTFRPSSAYQLRTISDDGGRVFFDTVEPLVPQDTNSVQDVYEWERTGSGTCHESKGCVYLISSNLSNEEAFLVDASASGDDVFFTTRAQLVPQDQNDLVDVYDARVNGGFPHVSTACTGTGCQGAPPAAPTFATPASVTFSGVGNVPPSPPPPPVTKPRPKSLTRAQKLARALRACEKKPKKQRASCRKLARRRYGPKPSSNKGGK